MHRPFNPRQWLLILHLLVIPCCLSAQKKTGNKYPSLLWEITGHGLHKPSYLFGTMHVSSKMVFHLSDSFYLAIKNAEMLALELDPQAWQEQMFKYQNRQDNLRFYSEEFPDEYINEKSFQLERYDEQLKMAMSDEPTLINGLLYRNYLPKADFEEDTYLDLYIYQTAKRLGKLTTGVENYVETENLILEASQDMMRETAKPEHQSDNESPQDLEQKIQDSYRKGDLDMLDSLERMMQASSAFTEKFLYRRNEIQTCSIDSILQKHTLFVGVGAAHLPGNRGVIELLRKKGYRLRPVSMQNHDAQQREDIDRIKVPVVFSTQMAEDRRFSVSIPGKLYRRTDSRNADSWEYADMANGAYYMITRIKTHAAFLAQTQDNVLQKIDSLLYENIPGKILHKTFIEKQGAKGYEILNKTRRGDIQRYQILETPFEILVFKMSGNGNYVEGKEAGLFFNSIKLNYSPLPLGNDFEPPQGGFAVKFPQYPQCCKNSNTFDGIPRWEYESIDTANRDAYLVWKKSIENFRFLEEDSFQISLMEESFQSSNLIEQTISREWLRVNGHTVLEAAYRLKGGEFIKARFILNGMHCFLIAAGSANRKSFSEFFDSFRFTPYKYRNFQSYTDSFLNIRVTTAVIPDIDNKVRQILEKAVSEEFLDSTPSGSGYWPRNKTAFFRDDSTGEAVYVSVQAFPKYYYPKDSADFWEMESNDAKIKEDLQIKSKTAFRPDDSSAGFKYIFSDSNSSRVISNWLFVKGNRLYRILSLGDSAERQSSFVRHFYETIKPLPVISKNALFGTKLPLFFDDLFSSDSVRQKKARRSVSHIYYGPGGVSQLISAINKLPFNTRDYFELKSNLIAELGLIPDSVSLDQTIGGLQDIFVNVRDTSILQQAVFRALAANKTKKSYQLLKALLLKDPPVFDNSNEYSNFFEDLGDSLRLARVLFPEILQLSLVDDYKDNIRRLLASLVDSNYISATVYSAYYNQLYFDARIQLKKQQVKEEKMLQTGEAEQESLTAMAGLRENEGSGELDQLAILLMPFYDQYPDLRDFFDQLLRSRDLSLRYRTSVLLLRHGMKLNDSIINSLAADERYRAGLYENMKRLHQLNLFPAGYLNQVSMAKTLLFRQEKNEVPAYIELVARKEIKWKSEYGFVYFFRYRSHPDDQWEMGISGIQPKDTGTVMINEDLVLLSHRKIAGDRPQLDQFNEQLKRLLYLKHKTAPFFYLDSDYYLYRGKEDE